MNTLITFAQGQQSGGGTQMFVMMALMFGIFYFMMIRPQQRKEKERQRMIAELRAGQRVAFAGGLTGTISEAKENTFMVEIAPKVIIEVARGSVSQLIEEDGKIETEKR